MKTLHLYLIRQVIATLLMTVLVFTFVFLLGNVVKEVLGLVMRQDVPLEVVVEAVGLLVPYVLVFALPMALLAATLLVFGRFSADQELTAARAGGISLLSLTTPILWLSLVLCGVSAYVNLQFGPSSRVAYKNLFLKLTGDIAIAQLPEGQFIKYFPGYIIYIGRNDRGQLQNVIIAEQQGGTNTSLFRAQRGTISVDTTNRLARINLYDVRAILREGGRERLLKSSYFQKEIAFDSNALGGKKPNLSNYTFNQLRAELRSLEETVLRSAPDASLTPEQRAHFQEDVQRQFRELASPVRVQMHRQVAFSFACFGFTLIGIPLAIRAHRRETSASFAIALVLVVIYYSFILAAESLATRPELYPHLIVWIPNFLFQFVGAALLWRANRGV